MPDAHAIAMAARFFECWPDCTDMAQDIENALMDELEGMDEDEADETLAAVTEIIETTFREKAAELNLKAQRLIEVRVSQEMRVQAVLDQFPLHYDKLDISIKELTDALYGANGIVGL